MVLSRCGLGRAFGSCPGRCGKTCVRMMLPIRFGVMCGLGKNKVVGPGGVVVDRSLQTGHNLAARRFEACFPSDIP